MGCGVAADDWQAGDLVACYGRDAVSRCISWGTASLFRRPAVGPSHVAMMVPVTPHGLLWVESTSLTRTPCVVRGTRVRGVQAHFPEDRLADYAGGRVEVYRLAPIEKLSRHETGFLSTVVARHFLSREITYDVGGALLSGTRVFQLSRLFPAADLNSLFCSELVAALLMRLNRLARDNPGRFHPARLLSELLRTGVYSLERHYGG